MTNKSIQQHINDDKDKLEDPTISPQMRRHVEDELEHLEKYQNNHPDEEHDPTAVSYTHLTLPTNREV